MLQQQQRQVQIQSLKKSSFTNNNNNNIRHHHHLSNGSLSPVEVVSLHTPDTKLRSNVTNTSTLINNDSFASSEAKNKQSQLSFVSKPKSNDTIIIVDNSSEDENMQLSALLAKKQRQQ